MLSVRVKRVSETCQIRDQNCWPYYNQSFALRTVVTHETQRLGYFDHGESWLQRV